MSNPFGYRAERLQPVEATTADDEQVCICRRGDERGDRFIRRFLAPAVDDLIDQPPVNRLPASGDDGR